MTPQNKRIFHAGVLFVSWSYIFCMFIIMIVSLGEKSPYTVLVQFNKYYEFWPEFIITIFFVITYPISYLYLLKHC